MLTIALARNPLDRSTWERFENCSSLPDFLLEKMVPEYGATFPETARIYREAVSEDNDVTPTNSAEAEALNDIKEGVYYVVVWPAGQAILAQVAISAVIALASFTLSHLTGVKDPEKVTKKRNGNGSPNNSPGDRQNQARVLERIPDIYGRVKATPDLLQAPYIRYEDNLQIETTYMCIGQGSYTVAAEDIKEGDTLVSSITGASVEVYPPGEVPGPSGTPQLTVGAPIDQRLYSVFPIKEVSPETLMHPNSSYILGETGIQPNNGGVIFHDRVSPLFGYNSGTHVGTIKFTTTGNYTTANFRDEIIGTIQVADKFGLDFVKDEVSVFEETPIEGSGGSGNRPDLSLLPETPAEDSYTVTIVDTSVIAEVTISFTVPTSKQSEWAKIATYNPAGGTGGAGPGTDSAIPAPAGKVYNRASIIYLLNYVQGPFFVNDPLMEEVHVNVTAPEGLGFEDGSHAYPHAVAFAVRVTPCDDTGTATGAPERFDIADGLILRATKNQIGQFIGQSFILTPSFQGRFLFECWRTTLRPFREDLRSYRGDAASAGGHNRKLGGTAAMGALITPEGNAINYYKVAAAFNNDNIQLTHAYSMSIARHEGSTAAVSDLGNVTTVQCKRVQRKIDRGVPPEKRLNMIVTRNVDLYDPFSGTFAGAEFPSGRGEDALFDVLRRSTLGNLADSNIDLDGIHEAFLAVEESFTDAKASAFSHTFDNKDASVEDMVAAIADACFVTVYRQGDIIKALPDISTQDSALLFNHRNKSPGSETRNVQFATEEEYDGVEVEYTDLVDNQIKLYTIPAVGVPRNARKLQLAGIRTRGKAAMHAWRAYNRLIYQDTLVEFDACEEASLGLVNEKILVADDTHPDTQDGEIIAVDGLILYTSQEVNLLGTCTLSLQGYEGEVANVSVTAGPNKRSLTLSGALPAGILYIDDEGNTRTKYILVTNNNPATHAFRVIDKSNKSLGVYSVKGYNYTDMYYTYDGVLAYLPFDSEAHSFPPLNAVTDRSPNEWELTLTGLASGTVDAARGQVYGSIDVGAEIEIEADAGLFADQSYTVACWIFNNGGGIVIAQSNSPSTSVLLGIEPGTFRMWMFHDGVQYMSGPITTTGEWIHLAWVYDNATSTMATYQNGGETSTTVIGTIPGHAAFDGWFILHGLVGFCDEFRIWGKAQPAEFIHEVYQKEFRSL